MEQLQRIFPVQYALVAFVIGATCAVITYRRGSRRDGSSPMVGAVAWGGIIFGLLVTVSITLPSFTGTATASDSVDFTLSSPSRAQTVVNLFLFGWAGLLLPLVRPIRVFATTVTVLAMSIATELLQFLLPTGRSAALMDIVLNTAGGLALALASVCLVRPALKLAPRALAPAAGSS